MHMDTLLLLAAQSPPKTLQKRSAFTLARQKAKPLQPNPPEEHLQFCLLQIFSHVNPFRYGASVVGEINSERRKFPGATSSLKPETQSFLATLQHAESSLPLAALLQSLGKASTSW